MEKQRRFFACIILRIAPSLPNRCQSFSPQCEQYLSPFLHPFATPRAFIVHHFPVCFVDNRCRNNARRHGDDGVAEQHNERRQHLANACNGRNVAIAHGCHRYYRPVDARADAAEIGIHAAFHHKHQRADDGNEDENEEEINQNLVQTLANGCKQQIALIDEREEFEDPEYTQKAKHTQDNHIAETREEHAEIGRKNGEQVYDAEKTEHIVAFAWRTIHSGYVFQM